MILLLFLLWYFYKITKIAPDIYDENPNIFTTLTWNSQLMVNVPIFFFSHVKWGYKFYTQESCGKDELFIHPYGHIPQVDGEVWSAAICEKKKIMKN